MTTEPLVTMMPDTGESPVQARSILKEKGFTCALLTLTTSEELPLSEETDRQDHLLFVIEGSISVRQGEINVVLNKDEAMLVTRDKPATIRNLQVARSKLLRTDILPPPAPPPLVTLPRRP